MNHVILIGRLTKDPTDTWTQGNPSTHIARYTLAVDRGVKDQSGKNIADFINCVTFNKGADFAEKYLRQGTKIAIEGRIQTGSYTNKDGQKVYTTDVIVSRHEFAESAKASDNAPAANNATSGNDFNEGFMAIPDNADDSGLPFN